MQRSSQQFALQVRPEHEPNAPHAPHAQLPSHARVRWRVPSGQLPQPWTSVSTVEASHALVAQPPQPVQSSQAHDAEQLRVLP